MLGIGIYGDQKNQIHNLISEILKKGKYDFHLSSFSLENISENSSNDYYDIAVLYFGENFKNQSLDKLKKFHLSFPKTLLFIISDNQDYVSFAFEINAFQFFFLPLKEDLFEKELIRAVLLKERKNLPFRSYAFLENHAEEIVYIRAENHCLNFLTRKGEHYIFPGSIKAAQEALKLSGYARIYKSLLVNVYYIQEVKKDRVILKNGLGNLPIGRAYKKILQQNSCIKSIY